MVEFLLFKNVLMFPSCRFHKTDPQYPEKEVSGEEDECGKHVMRLLKF